MYVANFTLGVQPTWATYPNLPFANCEAGPLMTAHSLGISLICSCYVSPIQGDLGRPFDFSTFDLGVTSRDLSMTLPVFNLSLI